MTAVETIRVTSNEERMIQYCYPSSVEEALACLERYDGRARIIAGGTDLIPEIRKGKVATPCLVDVTRIPELQRIAIEGDAVTVGAAVTFAEIEAQPFIRQRVHALRDAARSVGAGAIQNAATWVGNIVQAMPAADGAIVAIALDAEARIVGCHGARWEPVRELFAGPGVSSVDSGRELVACVRFRRPRVGTGTAWRRVGRRSALVLPILNCAVRVGLELPERGASGAAGGGYRIAEAAIALGPVAPRPSRAVRAEAFLKGRVPGPDVLRRAAEMVRSEANPRTSVMRASREYRLQIIPTLVREALSEAVERGIAEWEEGVCSRF